MLSFGTPGVLGSRVWAYDNPLDTISNPEAGSRQGSNSFVMLGAFPALRNPRYRRAVRVVEYMIALGAVANVVHNSMDLR